MNQDNFGKWTTYRRNDLAVNHGEIDQSNQLNMVINGFDFQGLVRSQQPQLVKSCVAQVLGHGIRTSLAVSTRAAATTDDNSGNDGFHEFLTWCVWLNFESPRLSFQMGKLMINHMILVHLRDGVGNAAEFIWNLKFVPSTPKFVRFSSCGGSNASLIFREISLFFFHVFLIF